MSESRDLHTALTQVQQTLANASTGNNLPLSKRAQAGRLLDPLTLLLHHIGEAIDRVLVNVLGSPGTAMMDPTTSWKQGAFLHQST